MGTTHFKKFGKYTILTKLASGGMADILLASELSPTGFGRFVVIKKALSKFSDNEEFKDMFKNEGKVACNLKHRNIVPVYEFGIEKNQFYLTMEYISGRNLRELIKRTQAYKSSISIPNAVHIIKEAASGLSYAHNAVDSNTGQPLNLIHRDISPQNMMLSFDGEVKLIDFGIAKIADTNLTRAGHLKGKFSYMSPEQAHGEVLDERTDIFCLGIILWELLTNKRLFASKNEMQSLKKIKNCDIPDAQKINPEIPTNLNEILKKALRKNKTARYKTASKLEQDLSFFLNKNYPEFSHYDFISLMKKSYRKEIMEEREKLKTYASDFKKYIHSLNIEDSFAIEANNSLTMNNLFNIEQESSKQKHTKTLEDNGHDSKTDMSLSNDMSDFFSHAESAIKEAQGEQSKAHKASEAESSTLIQRNRSDITQERTKDKSKSEKDSQTKKVLSITKSKAGVGLAELDRDSRSRLKEESKKRKTISSQNTSSSLYSSEGLIDDDFKPHHFDRKQNSSSAFLLIFAFLLLIGFSGAAYLTIKEYNITHFIKTRTLKKITDQGQGLELESYAGYDEAAEIKMAQKADKDADLAVKKVFINSNPSGAGIYINNEFSSKYTPSLIQLSSKETINITLKKEGFPEKNVVFNPVKFKNRSLNIILPPPRSLSSKDKIQIITE